MHTVELLEEAIALAPRLGVTVRDDWMGGPGGVCQLKGRTVLFLDLTQPPGEQLALVVAALRGLPKPADAQLSPELRSLVELRSAS